MSVIFLGIAAVGLGCQSSPDRAEAASANMGVVNDLCPIGEDPVNMASVSPEMTRQYQGQAVGFCCPGCVGYWDGMTEAEKAAEMAELAADGHAPGFKAR